MKNEALALRYSVMDPDAARIITAELAPNERLIWAGRPRRGLILHREDALYLPLGLYFVLVSVTAFLDTTITSHPPPDGGSGQPPLFTIAIFVVFLLYMAFGNLLFDARLRSTSFYGLTNERIIIVTRLLRRTLVSLPLKGLSDLTLMQGSSPDGKILFGPQPAGSGTQPGSIPKRRARSSLQEISNAKAIFNEILIAQKTAAP